MRIIIVADAQRQRLALSDTMNKLGFFVVGCIHSEQLATQKFMDVDVWLIDVDNYCDEFQRLVDKSRPKSVIVGFDKAPYVSDECYERWQNLFIRRLSLSLNCSLSKPIKKSVRPKTKWRYVVFLGASMGGPEAIKVFLDNISPNLPISVIVAQHFDAMMINKLPKILTRHNNWPCKVINVSQGLQTGTCLVVPIDRQIICDSSGRVILTKKPWNGDYCPDLGTLLKNLSDVYGSELISIIFSGMGSDGSQYAKQILPNNSFLWAQDPKTCASPSQPQAFIDTGVCQFVGSPKALADRLNKMLSSYMVGTLVNNDTK